MHIFPQFTKKKNCTKKAENFDIKLHFGKNLNQEGGAKIWISNLIYTPGKCSNKEYWIHKEMYDCMFDLVSG